MTPKRGRPPMPQTEGKRAVIALRVTAEMKRSLQEAADKSGRSLSQEAELRLERSFDAERGVEAFRADFREAFKAHLKEWSENTLEQFKRHLSESPSRSQSPPAQTPDRIAEPVPPQRTAPGGRSASRPSGYRRGPNS
jgi:TraY domain-containing protein